MNDDLGTAGSPVADIANQEGLIEKAMKEDPSTEIRPIRFTEQYGSKNALALVKQVGDKFRPVTPVRMVEMPEHFRVKIGLSAYIEGRSGDYLGVAPDDTLFVVEKEDIAETNAKSGSYNRAGGIFTTIDLTEDVQRRSQHFVLGLQHFEIGFIGTLGNHQIGELFFQIHIGSFFFNHLIPFEHLITMPGSDNLFNLHFHVAVDAFFHGGPAFFKFLGIHVSDVVGRNAHRVFVGLQGRQGAVE